MTKTNRFKVRSMVASFLLVCIAGNIHAGTPQIGDITAAVRDAGFAATWSVTVAGVSAPTLGADANVTAFDGIWDDNKDAFLLKKSECDFPTSPLVIEYTVPEAFIEGGSVVVYEIVFRTGHGPTGVGTKWDRCDTRRPTIVDVEGSHDGVYWVSLHTGVSGEILYSETTLPDPPAVDKDFYHADSKLSFNNEKSFRHYRIYVRSGDNGNSVPIIFNEIMLLGTYGGKICPPMQHGDIVAAVREAGYATSVACTHVDAFGALPDILFDGLLSRYGETGNQRFLVKNTEENKSNPMVVTLDIPLGFVAGGEVVVTGMTFEVGGLKKSGQSDPEVRELWGDARKRMPKSFMLEGSEDGVEWFEICNEDNFDVNGYVVVPHRHSTTGVECENYLIENVSFRNKRSARKYKITISGSQDPTNSYLYQISEIMLHGRYGAAREGLILVFR
ncbi:MAG: hypothetical protein E7049_11165 [Lentisphaerae bacterium]|nr:hypothetical protein [Lentisphaerota bacterium]